jgi:bifunctional non-homologous end joining protein LigD
MTTYALPAGSIPANPPRRVPLQIVSPSAQPPGCPGWLHEVKHDGHRLLAIVVGGELKLISRNGHDRTPLFRLPFEKLLAAGLPAMVLDGEIAVPDERGVTHIDELTEAMRQRRARASPISPSTFSTSAATTCAAARSRIGRRGCDLVGSAGCEHIVVVDYIAGNGAALFEAVRQIGAKGIVSKRAGSRMAAAWGATG